MVEEQKQDAAAAAQAPVAKKAAAEKQVGKFTRGDHMVHVLIQKGKKFVSNCEDDRVINLIVEIEVAGQKQYSTSKDEVLVDSDSPTVWDEHLFFELKNLEPDDAKNTNVVIRVMNRGWIKNELVGHSLQDLSNIYFKEKNKIEHAWVGLENPDAEDFQTMKGLLKVSLNVTGPNDNAQKLEMQQGPEPSQMKMLISPSIKRTFNQLTISIIEGHDLPVFSNFFASDSLECYFQIKYGGGNAIKTDVHNQVKGKVSIMQQFLLPVQTPVLADRLVIEIFDHNTFQDQQIGSLILSAKKLLAEGSKEGGFYTWVSLFGSPADNTGDEADKMNSNPEIASDWKGMVLLHIAAEENDKPKKGMETMDPQIKQQAKDQGFYAKEQYELIVEVGQGITLPKPDTDYKVQICVNDKKWCTEVPKEKKGEYVRWHDRSQVLKWDLPKNKYSLFTSKQEELANFVQEFEVYIYLLDEDDVPICFWHGDLSDFRVLDSKWKWIQLKPDKTYGKVENDHEAGMVSIKISAGRLASYGDMSIPFKEHNAWKKNPPRRIGAYQLRCFIFQCRDLPAADSNGSSDPFVKIFNTSGKNVSTTVIEDDVNPIFMECLEVALDFQDNVTYEDTPPCILDVFDADEGFISNSADFLGRCTIHIKDIKQLSDGEDGIPVPEWYDVRFGTDKSSPACGQILCSFALFPGDFLAQSIEIRTQQMKSMVEKIEFDVSINCLGLRELQSIGLIPIQKAFIAFKVNSLTDRSTGSLQTIQTQPNATGSNPNINSLVSFNIPLPVDPLYCPSLTCFVYDQVFLGLSQPQIGTFTIPLGQIKEDYNRQNRNMLDQARNILKKLKKFVEAPQDVGDIEIAINADEGKDDGRAAQTINTIEDRLLPTEADLLPLKTVQDNDDSLLMSKGRGGDTARHGPSKAGKKKKQSANSKREIIKQQELSKASAKDLRKQETQKTLDSTEISSNVEIPNYEYDKQLNVYREVGAPNKQIYKSVGYNDQDLIKTIMELMKQLPAQNSMQKKMGKKLATSLRKTIKRKSGEEIRSLSQPGKSHVGSIIELAKEQMSTKQKVMQELDGTTSQETKDVQLRVDLMEKVYDATNKHYRRYFEDELENDPTIFPKPVFYSNGITRGQSRGVEKSWFSFGSGQQDESGQESTISQVGKFKGTIEIVNKEQAEIFEQEKNQILGQIFSILSTLFQNKTGETETFDLSCVDTSEEKADFLADCERMDLKMPALTEFLEDVAFSGRIKELLKRQTEAVVHLYLIQGYDFASRDLFSPSDPFLIVRCGNTEVNDRDNYQNDEPNPKFMQRHDFTVSFPGAPPLVIEAYDYDMLFGDDLIGKTSIDLDDRFFNPKWQAIDEKPIETRELYHMSSQLNQGVIDMWLDIDPAGKSSDVGKVWDIKQEPNNEFEVRLAVFKCTGVPMEDWEGTSDVYIKCFINDTDKQETDTHYRCTTGNPSFNYRLLFDVTTPRMQPFVLTMQAWDRDLLKSNDLICQWQIDISEIIRDSRITKGPMNLQKKYYEESLKPRICSEGQDEPIKFVTNEKDGNPDSVFTVIAYHPDDKEKKKPITIFLDLRVVPQEYAAMNKVGAARGDPNVEPTLPPPEGRFKLSLNPFAMLNQLCGAALRRKIWCCVCCALCLVICYFVFPLLAAIKTLFFG